MSDNDTQKKNAQAALELLDRPITLENGLKTMNSIVDTLTITKRIQDQEVLLNLVRLMMGATIELTPENLQKVFNAIDCAISKLPLGLSALDFVIFNRYRDPVYEN